MAGAILRSAYPVVLGLGGWCLGALVVFVALPTLAIDDVWVVALSPATGRTGESVGVAVAVAHRWTSGSRVGSPAAVRESLGIPDLPEETYRRA